MESQADTDEAIQTRARSAERAAKEMALAQDNKEAALTKDREVLFKLLNSMDVPALPFDVSFLSRALQLVASFLSLALPPVASFLFFLFRLRV